MIGIPSLWASSVGLPGLIARPWHQISAPREGGDRGGGLVATADRRAGADDDQVAVASDSPQRVLQSAAVIGNDR